MITRFRVQNYKALRDVSIDLTPIHVLIGPNDSGKTSILEAMAALCRSVDHPLAEAFMGSWEDQQLVWDRDRDLAVSLTAEVEYEQNRFEYMLSCAFPKGHASQIHTEIFRLVTESQEVVLSEKGVPYSRVWSVRIQGHDASENILNAVRLIHASMKGVHSYRWDPRFLRLPVAPDSKRRFRMEPSGFGLSLCLDDILGYDRGRFIALESRFTKIFPQVRSLKLIAEPAFKSPVDSADQIPILQRSDGKGLYFEFSGGQLISAQQISDGLLLVLAYLTILYLPEPPRLLLIEEPENGIHPKRLEDLLSILRELVGEQAHTQVVLTTHSPYVIDLFKPEEVTLCQKYEDGSVFVQRLSESSTVRQQMDVFTLGEIWTAEGDETLGQPVASVATDER